MWPPDLTVILKTNNKNYSKNHPWRQKSEKNYQQLLVKCRQQRIMLIRIRLFLIKLIS